MDQELDALGMLNLMIQPGFCVENNRITDCNAAARGLLLEPGMELCSLLHTGHEEYAEFTGGCLYLTLSLGGEYWGAAVYRRGNRDIFLLEEPSDQAELRAMALAARELRDPLSSIMTTADRIFPLTARDEDPFLQEQVARLNRGLYQMLRVIGNMSDAESCATLPRLQLQTLDIRAFMEELFSKAASLMVHGGQQLHFENLPGPLFCLVDRDKLERAVFNILSNAMKFTPAGQSIHARLIRRETRLYLTIQDSGEGIPQEIRGSIHNRYLRRPGIEDGRFGIGLGMVLIRSTAAAHGGTVLIDHPGECGTRITMTLPIRQNPDNTLRSHVLRIDYAGERDHALIELSDALPPAPYEAGKIN